MQPWAEKASSSSHANSLHYDRTLSHLNNMSSLQQSGSNSAGFRTTRGTQPLIPTEFESTNLQGKQPFQYNFEPKYTTSQDSMSLSDGAEVMSFLNTVSYSDHVHGDDLRPDSMSYISHRHQLDTQHSLAEREKLAALFGTEDIVEYLRHVTYTEDIYGIPVLGNIIKEAQEEIKNTSENRQLENRHVAVDRLSMIRNHLVQRAQGDFELAAQNAFRMKEDDWSANFFDSSL